MKCSGCFHFQFLYFEESALYCASFLLENWSFVRANLGCESFFPLRQSLFANQSFFANQFLFSSALWHCLATACLRIGHSLQISLLSHRLCDTVFLQIVSSLLLISLCSVKPSFLRSKGSLLWIFFSANRAFFARHSLRYCLALESVFSVNESNRQISALRDSVLAPISSSCVAVSRTLLAKKFLLCCSLSVPGHRRFGCLPKRNTWSQRHTYDQLLQALSQRALPLANAGNIELVRLLQGKTTNFFLHVLWRTVSTLSQQIIHVSLMPLERARIVWLYPKIDLLECL